MDSCSKQQQGRNIIFTNNKQTNNFSINSIKQQDLTMMNKTLTNAGFNWTDELIVHAPGWGNGFMVECLPVFELLSRYITRHDKTQQDKTRMKMTEIEEVTCMTVITTETYPNVYSSVTPSFSSLGCLWS